MEILIPVRTLGCRETHTACQCVMEELAALRALRQELEQVKKDLERNRATFTERYEDVLRELEGVRAELKAARGVVEAAEAHRDCDYFPVDLDKALIALKAHLEKA